MSRAGEAGSGGRRPEGDAASGAGLLPFVRRLAATLDLEPGSENLKRLLAEGIALGAAKVFRAKTTWPEPLARADRFTLARLEREFAAQIEPAGDPLDRLLRAGRLYETVVQSGSKTARRASGSFFTPPGIARYAAGAASAGLETRDFHDPACGAGSLLAALRLAGGVPLEWLHGTDLDPVAVHLARVLLWLADGASPESVETVRANLRCADGLAGTLPEGAVVIANPPFVKGVVKTGAAGKAARNGLRRRLPLLQGAFDLAAAFWALADHDQCRRTVLVLPNRLLAAGYTARLREAALLRGDSVTIRDFSRQRAFGSVGVYPVVLTLDRDGRGEGLTGDGRSTFRWKPRLLRGRSWSAALSAEAMKLLERDPLRLGEVATVTAGQTTAEAYETKEALGTRGEFLFVTAGAIEPHRILRDAPQRFLGKDWKNPRLAAKAMGARRARIARTPKLLVAAMGRRIEAALDLKGEIAPAVSVFTVIPKEGGPLGPGALSALLNSRPLAGLFTALHGAQAMSGGYISVTRPMLEDLPLAVHSDPARIRRLEALGLALSELPETPELLEEADELAAGLLAEGKTG